MTVRLAQETRHMPPDVQTGFTHPSGQTDVYAGRRPDHGAWQPHQSVADDAARFGQQPATSRGTERNVPGV